MMIIDAHLHLYKSRQAGRKAIGGESPTGYYGQPEELFTIMERSDIGKVVAVITVPALFMFEAARERGEKSGDFDEEEARKAVCQRIVRANDWLLDLCRKDGRFVPFPYLDPFMGDGLVEEAERVIRAGAEGVKIHPSLGRFWPDDGRLNPVYEVLQNEGVPILFHCGVSKASPDVHYSRPSAFFPVIKRFPGLRMVLAHMGCPFWDEVAEVAQRSENVLFDTSNVVTYREGRCRLGTAEVVSLIKRLGTDRVLFGSDFPWSDPVRDLEELRSLGLSPQELELVSSGNASGFLGF